MLRNTRSWLSHRADFTTVLRTKLDVGQCSPVIAELSSNSPSFIQVLGDCGIKRRRRLLVVVAELENYRRCRLHNLLSKVM